VICPWCRLSRCTQQDIVAAAGAAAAAAAVAASATSPAAVQTITPAVVPVHTSAPVVALVESLLEACCLAAGYLLHLYATSGCIKSHNCVVSVLAAGYLP
jgi:hypothetical protein